MRNRIFLLFVLIAGMAVMVVAQRQKPALVLSQEAMVVEPAETPVAAEPEMDLKAEAAAFKLNAPPEKENPKLYYGTASYYANMFQGRPTANGEIFRQEKLTAACNVLPLGTWVKVTNLKNGRSVIVKINDRLHPRMKRVVDLSRAAASKLNYINSGLTKVRVEVLGKKKPA